MSGSASWQIATGHCFALDRSIARLAVLYGRELLGVRCHGHDLIDGGSRFALVGGPARAAMLQAMMDGRALTAGELMRRRKYHAADCGAHLNQLCQRSLPISVAAAGAAPTGYHRLGSPRSTAQCWKHDAGRGGTMTPRDRTGPHAIGHCARRARVTIILRDSSASALPVVPAAGFRRDR